MMRAASVWCPRMRARRGRVIATMSPAPSLSAGDRDLAYQHGGYQRVKWSDWSKENFKNTEAKNDFYKEFGYRFKPGSEDSLADISTSSTPDEILALVQV